ncbi:helix-turn-helix domain-containing protein [Clostridium sp. Mt-5]|uniref:Helix-turn-helix domain-containing protein n=1 Tax=Clostridium moutaii TaxID=3240932 RepID=A0ABV4BWY6_9CLOT
MEISNLGLNIKKFRIEKGWNLKKLKEESGIGYATLHDIESGKTQNLNSSNIEKVAAALGKTTDELLGVEVEIIEKQVGDLEETIKAILSSDELTIDGENITNDEKAEIYDLIAFEINSVRRRRKSCRSNE